MGPSLHLSAFCFIYLSVYCDVIVFEYIFFDPTFMHTVVANVSSSCYRLIFEWLPAYQPVITHVLIYNTSQE